MKYKECRTSITVPVELEVDVTLVTEFNPGYPETRDTPAEPAGHEIQNISYRVDNAELRSQIDSWLDEHWTEIEFAS